MDSRGFLRRFKSSKADIELGREILKKFIIQSENKVDRNSTEASLENDSLKLIYKNWNLHSSSPLPIKSPIDLTPYQFLSMYNNDKSYITIPRLSVTKLLTDSWCELREYYSIYGVSRFKTSKAITQGLRVHENLETTTHKVIDTTDLSKKLEVNVKQKVDEIERQIQLTSDPEEIELQQQRLAQFNLNAYGNIPESKLAIEWAQSILSRLFTLFSTSEAREVLIHGYIDLNKGEFCHEIKSNCINNQNNVLVSGIVDQIRIVDKSNPRNLDLFETVNHNLEYEFPNCINNIRIIDFSRYFDVIGNIIKDFHDYEILVTDVKTRGFNSIPGQKSVIESAKYQTFYYRKFLGLLSNENTHENFAYYSLLENARIRGVDVDKPINYSTIVQMLRKFPDILYQDFTKLSNGDKIGFKPFDDFHHNLIHHYYNLNDYFDSGFHCNNSKLINDLNEVDDFDYKNLFTEDILKQWQIPPTLRYFAARGNQFYRLCSQILGDTTTVEYHNHRTNSCFHTNTYDYDEHELNDQLYKASTFWNGKRVPIPTTDLDKCKYCDFSPKCVVPNPTR